MASSTRWRESDDSHQNLMSTTNESALEDSEHGNVDECTCYEKSNRSRKTTRSYIPPKFIAQCYIFFGMFIGIGISSLAMLSQSTKSNKEVVRSSPFPSMPQETKVIRETKYETPPPPGHDYDQEWETFFPNKGYIWIEEPHKYNLPPGLPSTSTNTTNTYGLTWVHQFHCTNMIRIEFWKLIRGESSFAKSPVDQLDKLEKRRLHHMNHCFDYLRQTILCNADMTVEWDVNEPDELGNQHHINGYGVPHTCTSWDYLWKYVMDHQPPKEAEDTPLALEHHHGDKDHGH